MKKRLLGGAFVVGILLLAFLLGNIVFRIVMTITSILGLKELIDIKYKKKKEYYLKLYNHSKIKYYLTFISKLLSKYLRKRLPYEILDITKGCLLMYCLFDTGILNIIYRKIKKK